MKKTGALRILVILIGMGTALPTMAATILDWSADDAMSTATGDIDLALDAGTVQGLIRNYTPGSAIMSSTVSSEYTENSIYGIIQVENTGGAAATTIDTDAGNRMDQSTPSLWIGVDGNVPSEDAAVRSIASLVWFDLDVAAPASDYVSAISLGANNSGGISDVTVRFAIQSDGAWYVSSDNLTDDGTLSYSGANWASLTTADSSSTSLMTAEGLTYDVAGTSLDNITAVGFFEEGATPNDTARARIKMDALTVETIPEPATLGLIAGAGGALLIFRRRFMI